MKFKLFFSGFLFILFGINTSLFSQTTLTITDATFGNTGSADVILAQAETLANSGQNVTVNMNAPALCDVGSVFLAPTSGTITIQKDPSATTVQGFVSSIHDYYCIIISSNELTDITIKNITIDNFGGPVFAAGIKVLTIDNVTYENCGSMLDLDDAGFYSSLSPVATQTVMVQNCVYNNPLNYTIGRPHIYRQNSKNSTPAKTFKVLNNQFKDPIAIRVGTNATVDDLDIEIKNNFSATAKGWTCYIGDGDFVNNLSHINNDYGFNLIFDDNQDVRLLALTEPLNDWKVENNVFNWMGVNFASAYLYITAYMSSAPIGSRARPYKTSFINAGSGYCSNQSYLNGNNTFNYRSDYPLSPVGWLNYYWAMMCSGNNTPDCALSEFTNLEIPGAIIISGNVSVRKCKIFASAGANFPISSSNGISAVVLPFAVSSGSVSFSYTYTGISTSDNNDLYVDVYKSNANGDLLDYIGEQMIPAASITGFSTVNLPIPVGVSLTSSDRIAVTLTGLHPVGSSNVVAKGTSKAYYNLPPCEYGFGIVQKGPYCLNSNIDLNISSSFGCTIPGTSYAWNFGDGHATTSTNLSVSHQYTTTGTYTITLTILVTLPLPGWVNEVVTQTITTIDCTPSLVCDDAAISIEEGRYCINAEITMSAKGCCNPEAVYNWSFGDGLTETGTNVSHSYASAGTYVVQLTIVQAGHPNIVKTQVITISDCIETTCKDCIGSFQPSPGKYIVSLWVREDVSPLPQTYNNAKVEISFLTSTGYFGPLIFGTNSAKNKIIDGWQRIEEEFTIPSNATDIKLKLLNTNSGAVDAYFDDLRVFPADGQMKTYVYDPITFRLAATLDENNYATFYEYDEEGILIRVKKETEKGIMTIQESRQGNKKK